MHDFILGGVPWPVLGIALLLCLIISALGFRRVDWFISLGYGYSIAAQTALFAITYPRELALGGLLQLLLLAAYGLRLGIFLTLRERQSSFAHELKASQERSLHVRGLLKLVIWVSVSALYVAMAAPAALSLQAHADGIAVASLWPGIVLMVLGLGLEALADQQKSAFKAQAPRAFMRTGLFALVRSPNYFGEMVFWLGTFASGLSAYRSVAAWVIAGTGLVCILLIMLGSARRLETKQAERYGSDPAYQDYARRVPVLIPFLPFYSLRRLRIYLG
jgi:steroid 5-alpha reductase family enzyme